MLFLSYYFPISSTFCIWLIEPQYFKPNRRDKERHIYKIRNRGKSKIKSSAGYRLAVTDLALSGNAASILNLSQNKKIHLVLIYAVVKIFAW